MRRTFLRLAAFVLVLTASPVALDAQRMKDFTTPTPLPRGRTLIIGFLGGLEKWNVETHRVRKLALELREMELPGVYVETVENHHRKRAIELIKKALDQNGDGTVDEKERQSLRIILYGHSMGGAAVVKTARELKKMGVAVALTVQIDSVGVDDAVIPSNVARAANLYQHDGIVIRGRSEIRAEDPQKTEILGNFQYHYRGKHVEMVNLPWYHKAFPTVHMKMERDPEVWAAVKNLILDTLQQPMAAFSASHP